MAYTFAVSAHFVLPLGYFKAKQQFFIYEPEAVREDLRHMVERHFPDQDLARVQMPSKPTRLCNNRAFSS